MKTVMRRNGGGNSTSANRGQLTDLYVSPEAVEDIRNWELIKLMKLLVEKSMLLMMALALLTESLALIFMILMNWEKVKSTRTSMRMFFLVAFLPAT